MKTAILCLADLVVLKHIADYGILTLTYGGFRREEHQIEAVVWRSGCHLTSSGLPQQYAYLPYQQSLPELIAQGVTYFTSGL